MDRPEGRGSLYHARTAVPRLEASNVRTRIPDGLVLASTFILAILAGVSLVPQGHSLQALGIGLAAGGAAGSVCALAFRRPLASALVLAFVAAAGVLRAAGAVGPPAPPWTAALDERIEVVGRVDAVDTRGTSGFVQLAVDTVEATRQLAVPSGMVRLTVPPLPSIEPGDRLRAVGRFEPVDPNTATGQRLLSSGIVAVCSFPDVEDLGSTSSGPLALLDSLRIGLTHALERALPQPQAGLVVGLLVGGTESMTDDLRQALIATGTAPLVVVSGYNITLVAGALIAAFRGSAGSRAVIPIVGVWLYTLVATITGSSIRAALMATIALGARRLGRGTDPLGALILVVATMLALTPSIATDLGFQLSVVGTLGIITLQPRVSALLPFLPRWVREPLAGTLAAQLPTIPILASSFHQLSTIAPLTNTLAAPMVPIATIAAGIAAPVVVLVPGIAPLATLILIAPATYLLGVISIGAGWPGALVTTGAVPGLLSPLYAGALIVWAALPTPEGRDLLGRLKQLPLAPLAGGAAAFGATGSLLLGTAFTPSLPTLSVSVFDGSGTAGYLIRTPAGTTLLVDGGRSPSAVSAALGSRMPFLSHQLTMAILTRADPDRLPGLLGAIVQYPAGLTIAPSEPIPAPFAERWRSTVGERSLEVIRPIRIDLEPDLHVQIMPTEPVPAASPPANPARTLAVRLEYRNVALLIGPGLNPESVHALEHGGGRLAADVWFIPRSGALGSFDAATLAAIGPRLAVIPVETGLRVPRVDPGIRDLLSRTPTYRTDVNGTIEVATDGNQVWVRPERD